MKQYQRQSVGKNADLHTHTHYSTDGTRSIKHILKVAHKNNTTMPGVTDHNTLLGVNKFLDKENIDRNNVMELVNGKTILVPGVEITARINEIKNLNGKSSKFHFVVYGIDRNDDSPISKLLKIKSNNDHHVDLGFVQELKKHFNLNITNQDVLEYKLYRNYGDERFKAFGKDETLEFAKYLGLNLTENDEKLIDIIDKFHTTDRLNLDAKDVINLVHASGGIILLAHPYTNLRRTNHTSDIINYLIENEIDGFEMYYPNNIKSCDTYLRKVCKDKKIYLHSGGSDYHDDKIFTYDKYSQSHKQNQYITYEPITLDKVSAFIDYLNEIKEARKQGTLIIKNYQNLRGFDVNATLEKYRQMYCNIENITLSTPFEEIEPDEMI